MKKGHKKGKKGHKMLKDKGHKKKGFKKIYHKEEWGKKKRCLMLEKTPTREGTRKKKRREKRRWKGEQE